MPVQEDLEPAEASRRHEVQGASRANGRPPPRVEGEEIVEEAGLNVLQELWDSYR